MPRRPPVALAAAALVAACSTPAPHATGPVTVVPSATLTAAGRTTCAALVSGLPHVLGSAVRRTTRPDPTRTAAWGDPPITLLCGGPAANPLDDTFTVDGMLFAVHDVGPANTWTTVRRTPPVVLTFPDAYQNQAELVGALVGPLSGRA